MAMKELSSVNPLGFSNAKYGVAPVIGSDIGTAICRGSPTQSKSKVTEPATISIRLREYINSLGISIALVYSSTIALKILRELAFAVDQVSISTTSPVK